MDWILANPEVVATILLTVFAGVQIWREGSHRKDRQVASENKALGPAWLVRRNCEAAILAAVGETSAWDWRASAGDKLDLMQENILAMLPHSAEAGGGFASAGVRAYSHFLGFSDRINDDKLYQASQRNSHDSPKPTQEERVTANTAAKEALVHLLDAVKALEAIAPRQPHEPELPAPARFPLLTGNAFPDGKPEFPSDAEGQGADG